MLWLVTSGAVLIFWTLAADESQIVTSAIDQNDTHVGMVTTVTTTDDSTSVTITVDGREYPLTTTPALWSWSDLRRFFAEDDAYREGQLVQVAVDTVVDHAYDITRHEPFSWRDALFGLVFLVGLTVAGRRYMTRNLMLPDGARWCVWHTRRTTTVSVIEVRERRPPRVVRALEAVENLFEDHTHQLHHLVIEVDGRVYFWETKTDEPTIIEPGMTFQVMGRVRLRGWIVGLTEPTLYPSARLN